MAGTGEDVTHIVWKLGDADSTARVAEQTGIDMDALNKMADNFFRTVIDWQIYGRPMTDLYYQCKMTRRELHDSTEVTVGWIEARGARVGAQVELLDLDRPKELWTVAEVWGAPLDKAALQAKQAADRKGFPSIGRQR